MTNERFDLPRALIAAAILSALAACGKDEAPKASAPAAAPPAAGTPAPAGQAAAPAAAASSATKSSAMAVPAPTPDAVLARTVKKALETDPEVNDQAIDVTSKSGIVTLWGTVESQKKREMAAKAAAKVKDVKSVTNNLAVVKGS